MSNLIWDQNVFPLLLSHFPGQCTHFRWFLPPSKDSASKQEIGAKWGRKLPKSDHKLVSKGGKRSKEGPLGGTLLVGQVRQRIPLPPTAGAARCFGLFGISARAPVATTWHSPTIRYLQTTICPKSIRSCACPLITPSSPLSTPISDHFLIL